MAREWLSDDSFWSLQSSAAWLWERPLPAAPAPETADTSAKLPMPRRELKPDAASRPSPMPVPPLLPEQSASGQGFAAARELHVAPPPSQPQVPSAAEIIPSALPEPLPRPVNDLSRLVRYPSLRKIPSFMSFGITRLNTRRLSLSLGILPRLDGRWIKGRGVRLRVNYLNPLAFSRANGIGVEYQEIGRRVLNRGEVLPRSHWGAYAIYHRGQTVQYEIEMENTGATPISRITIFSNQEVLNPQGGRGRRLGEDTRTFPVAVLGPGEKARIKASFRITANWARDGSFEQTHVKVTGHTPGLAIEETLLDAPQAGIVDPPPED